jgi:hypothetical protein
MWILLVSNPVAWKGARMEITVATAFSVFRCLNDLRNVYNLYNTWSYNVIDKTASIIPLIEEKAAEKEFLAASQALEDAKHSSNPAREIGSAIILLRTALSKTGNLEKSYQISMTIALYYRLLGEVKLARLYGTKSIEYVDQYIENYIVTIEGLKGANILARDVFGDYLSIPVQAAAVGVAMHKYLLFMDFFKAFWSSLGIAFPLSGSYEDFISPDPKIAKETARKAHDAFSLYVNNLLD